MNSTQTPSTNTEAPAQSSAATAEMDVNGKSQPATPLQRRVLAGGAIGQFIEFYDFTLYGLSAVVLAHHFFPSSNDLTGLLATFATFAAAFVIRPLGGLFFGALGDRVGRKNVLFVTLLTIGGATALIGLLPTYEQIGVAAPILLVLCRLLQGFSAGGESVGAPTFTYEHAPTAHRGKWLNTTIAATALPSVFGGALILGLTAAMGSDAFESWGWRIPFLLAAPLAVFGLWIRLRTEESDAFKETLSNVEHRESSPIREAFRENGLRMVQVVFVMGLTAMGFYFLSGYFVTYVKTTGGLSQQQSLIANAAAMSLYTLMLPLTGMLGDRFGRRPMLIAGTISIAILAVPCFAMVTSGSLAMAIAGQMLFVIPLTIYGGGCYTFFVEAFTTRTRFTSAAISYNTGYALFGGTAPFVGTWLVGSTGFDAAPGVYMAIAAAVVLAVIVATRVPETRHAAL
ncbi:MFS transporter [Gordonia jacobaea]|uniref:MFS transporter n=1 Tax=Gordonia jacobaea TaxID=122202 RepID=UPI0022E95C68|nr:MFS transporter [Gordonia jacobaea]